MNLASHRKFLPYPEQHQDFSLPKRYQQDPKEIEAFHARQAAREKYRRAEEERALEPIRIAPVIEKKSKCGSSELTLVGEDGRVTVVDEEEDDPTLVDWYGEGESHIGLLREISPQHSFHRRPRESAQLVRTLSSINSPLLIRTLRRPRWRKWLVVFDVCLLTVTIDLASPALSPGVKLLMKEFHVGQIPATLATSVYILGLGIGPLVLSPLSEIPGIGRNKPYIVTLFLFTILQIPTALVSNYPGLLVLRFM